TLCFWRQKNRSLNSSSREAKSLQNYCNFSKHASVPRFFLRGPRIFLSSGALSHLRMQRYNLFPNRQTFSTLFFEKNRVFFKKQQKQRPYTYLYIRAHGKRTKNRPSID
ncbi:MAG: hypothetical protein IJ632_03075, partial [Muribaculaceae bacterium]|nr:hypothetical protein [Muribaculaceae bacterium]